MYFNVTFKWYDTDTYCSNIASAATADDVAAHYGSKYPWFDIQPATENDVNDAKRRGKPIIKCGPAPAPSDKDADNKPAADAEPADTAPAESMKGSDSDSTTAAADAAPVAGPTAVIDDDSTNDDSNPATADAAPAEAIPAAVDLTPAALRGRFCLSHRVTVYVPSTVDAVAGAGAAKIRENKEKTAETLSRLFGGATETYGRGYWISSEYGLIREEVSPIYSNCTAEQLETNAAAVIRLCEFLRDDMRQECISLEIDGKLYFI